MRKPSRVRIGLHQGVGALVLVWLCGLGLGCSAYDSTLLSQAGIGGSPAIDAGTTPQPDAGGDAAVPALNLECTDNPAEPRCTRAHAQTVCASGSCFIASCDAPFADCDNEADNGCEALLDSTKHCGLCGAACQLSHGEAACVEGQCVLARCKPGFGDCDSSSDNGCETALDSVDACGACNTTCGAVDDGISGCVDGACAVVGCVGAYGDCNHDPEDGCEQKLNTLSHCGGCDESCSPAHATGVCSSGQCVVDACTGDFVDCNGLVGDGCEARLDTAEHCGTCSRACTLQHAQRQRCDDSQAIAECAVDHACPTEQVGCNDGDLTNGCTPGFADCDQASLNGCETDLTRLTDCGACDNSCVTPHTLSECDDGECKVVGCMPGYDLCDAGETCDALASDPAHCGSCETQCSGDSAKCAGGKCTGLTCGAGTADCDGMAGNACETSLDTTANCGVCNNSCGPFPHATALCEAPTLTCKLGPCETGFRDCDGDVSNGCEVDIRTLNDCGACDVGCSIPNAQASCATGSCVLSTCDLGRADCNGQVSDGCETNLNLPGDCGACENDCANLPNVLSSGCLQGKCQYVCDSDRADCDKSAANGCEANLATSASCGACGNDCSKLPHVSAATCDDDSCRNLVCTSGWADCNGDPSDGCERSTRTLRDCGACNQACAPAHASASCSTGTCQITTCNSGFDNCSGGVSDGCETALSSPDHCGSCTKKCSGSLSCVNGQCACTKSSDCSGGAECCDGTCTDTGGACFVFPCIPGTARSNNANCGGCGDACGLWCCSI